MNSELQSNRLQLIQSQILHAPTLFDYWTDPEVTKFMNMESLSTIADVIDMIDLFTQLATINQAIRYTILIKNTNEIIGSCGFNYVDFENGRAEIGYDLGKDYWGKGYASESVYALMNYWFHDLGLNRIEAKVEPKNNQSILLLEKSGFQFEGVLRQSERSKDGYIDVMMYSKLKNDEG